ncbi:MAG: M23 family peptidase [Betaproteobacteria bacterium]|nr:MAG: M23 family peptidase [Betaproteobacteria bacterium]
MRKGLPRPILSASSASTINSSAPRLNTASCPETSSESGFMASRVCYNPRAARRGGGSDWTALARKLRILAQSETAPGVYVVRVVAALALMALGGVAAFALAPDTTLESVPSERIVRDLVLPPMSLPEADQGYWREEQIRRGDTLGSVLARLGVDDAAAQSFLRADGGARSLYQLRPGRSLRALTDGEGKLIALRSLAPNGELLAVDRAADREGVPFVARSAIPEAAMGLELRANEIRTSLFAAADAVGLPDTVTTQLTDIFGGDVDFHHDLRQGDRFTVVYETRRIEGDLCGTGKIIAAEFINKGIAYRAFLWRGPDGTEDYYGDDGRSARKAFLRSPVAVTRVTSGFSMARLHPFLQNWRAHKGVDFAAPEGTPVHASGSGKVIVSGEQGGYGNVVMLQHGETYSTVYAHLSRFAPGIKRGAHVAQGELIGYVGQTGWATGPHLHYEFRVDNVQEDPLTVALPNAQPVPAAQKVDYLARVVPLAQELALGRGIVLAGGE